MTKTIRSIRQQIADDIRADVLCARMAPGERLSEEGLAKRFGVSRGPVREALSQLVCEGLLISKPKCGVSVAPVSKNEVHELIIPIRQTIETYALQLYYDELTPRDYLVWQEIMLKMELARDEGDENEMVLQDILFHRYLITRAALPELLALWQAILIQIRGHFGEKVVRYRDNLQAVVEHHRKLIDVFRKGDRSAAIAELKRHIS